MTFTGSVGEVQSFTVTVDDDAVVENDETLQVFMRDYVGPESLDGTETKNISDDAILTILNDDVTVLSLDEVSVTEGDAPGTVTVDVTVTSGADVQDEISINVSTADDTAGSGGALATGLDDYVPVVNEVVTFPAGTSAGDTQTVTITINGDDVVENDETISVEFSGGFTGVSSANVTPYDDSDTGEVTIDNNDAVVITLNDPSGNEDDGEIEVTLTTGLAVQGGFSLNVNSTDGTAELSNADYTRVQNQPVTFSGTAGEVQSFTITITVDDTVEEDETLSISMADYSGPTSLATTTEDITDTNTVTIINDDQTVLTIADVSINEDEGPAVITVVSTNAVQGGFDVDVNTLDVSATQADSDYTDAGQTLSFAGTSNESVQFNVTLGADDKVEIDEELMITMDTYMGPESNSGTVTHDIADDAVLTIVNDDQTVLTIANQSGLEDDGAMTITVTSSNQVDGGFLLNLDLEDDLATVADLDYTDATPQLSFDGTSDNETQTFIVVPTTDSRVESDETLDVVMSTVAANTTGITSDDFDITDSAVVTITNDDAAEVRFTAGTTLVSQDEETTTMTFVVELTNPVDVDVEVPVNVTGGTAAGVGVDFTVPGTTVVIPADDTTVDFDISIVQETIVESDETIELALAIPDPTTTTLPASEARDVTLSVSANTATGTVVNTDQANVTIASVSTIDEPDNGETSNLVFTVTLDEPVDGGFDINFTTEDGVAIAGSDFIDNDNSLNFTGNILPADEFREVIVVVTGDNTVEAINEDLSFVLGAITMGNTDVDSNDILVAMNTATVNIVDNDQAIAQFIESSISQDEESGTMTFEVELTNPVDVDVDVAIDLSNVTTEVEDYVLPASTTLTFVAGDQSEDYVLSLVDDAIVEIDEEFDMSIGTITPAATRDVVNTGVGSSDGTIVNTDQATVSLSASTGSVNEGLSGTTDLIFVATLDNPVDDGFTLAYTTDDVSTTAIDYNDNDDSMNFSGNAGEAMTITVPVVGDNIVEADETLNLSLGAVSGATVDLSDILISGTPQVGTIVNDDAADVIMATSTLSVSQNEEIASMKFTIELTNPVDIAVEVPVNIVGGTAQALGTDYTVPSTTVTFAAGDESEVFDISIENDVIVEADETILLALGSPSLSAVRDVSTSGSQFEADGTIVNTDQANLTLTATNASVSEANAGADNLTFTATLSAPVDQGFDVAYTSDNGTALAGSDYVNNDGALTFNGNSANEIRSFDVVVLNNDVVEPNIEEMTASLGVISLNNTGIDVNDITIVGNTQTGSIIDDDVTTITLEDVSGDEGDSPDETITLNITSSHAVEGGFSILVNTTDGTATIADSDYTGLSDELVMFAGTANESETVSIVTTADTKVEADETVSVAVSDASGLSLTFDTEDFVLTDDATVTILNDDEATITISEPIAVDEGDSGDNTTIVFSVTLSNEVDQDVTVDFATSDVEAAVGLDYVSEVGTLTFNAGAVGSQSITVEVIEDAVVELPTETFELVLSDLDTERSVTLDGGAATLTSVGTITDDDSATIAISDAEVSEGNDGTVTLSFDVEMTGQVDQDVVVSYTIPSSTATVNDDYTLPALSNVTITTGSTLAEISIPVNGDEVVELDETINITLTTTDAGARDVSFSATNAVGTITNDDSATITVADVEIEEGDASFSTLTFTAVLDNEVDESITVDFNTQDDGAVAGSDYLSNNGTLTFNGSADESRTFSVQILGDEVVEADELFNIVYTNFNADGRDVTMATSTMGTILNNDQATLAIDDVSMTEGNTGMTNFEFIVTLDGEVDQAFTLDYTTQDVVDGATIADSDYVANSGSLNFSGADGEEMTITVEVNGDLVVEVDEVFEVLLSTIDADGKNVVFSDELGEGTIENDDSLPVVTPDLAFDIDEDAANTTQVGEVTSEDLNGSPAWSITDGNADGIFTIGAADGIISVTDNTNLDRETTDIYTITVTVSDGLNTSDPETVSITINDVNDNPPVITADQSFTISDDALDETAIGVVAATDVDLNTTFSSWLIVSGNEDGVVEINPNTGELFVADGTNLDFDVTSSYTLGVTVFDGNVTSAEVTVTITVIDTNDAPTDMTLTDSTDEDGDTSNVDILESVGVGTLIGFFETTDVDLNDSHTYELVDGDGSLHNHLFEIAGTDLRTFVMLDFEETAVASIRVRTTDAAGESFEKVFTITLIQDTTLPVEIWNTITPNNDGYNDTWIIDNISSDPQAQIIITDVYKNVVYNSIGYTVPFDGTFNGNPLPTGAYPFSIKLSTGEEIKGILHILRLKN
ncbi:MAG: cadherin domain-containing protein [Cyclobacteriaceae bacterium]